MERQFAVSAPALIWPPVTAVSPSGMYAAMRFDEPTVTQSRRVLTQVVGTVEPAYPHEWLRRFQSELASLLAAGDDWDSYGAPAPNQEAFLLASYALSVLFDMDCEPTSIAPSTEGGIGISLDREGRIASLELTNDGEAYATTADLYRSPKVWSAGTDSDDIRSALIELRAFIES